MAKYTFVSILFIFFSFLLKGQSIHLEKTIDLPDMLSETSGLLYYNGNVWTFNDSGGEPEIFGYSLKDSSVFSTLTLWKGKNYDWEEITCDSSNVYIGDFGNNFGNRNNLTIYIIKNNYFAGKVKGRLVNSSRIRFSYPGYDPEPFNLKKLSAFDCEAMVWHNDSIYLFTKDWVKKGTVIYSLPAKPGKYTATKIGGFNSGGLITAASFYNGTLYLLGYQSSAPFLWIFKNVDLKDIHAEDGTRINLTVLKGEQTEGLAVVDEHTILISAEKTKTTAHLFQIRLK